jgi:hypothetical protein
MAFKTVNTASELPDKIVVVFLYAVALNFCGGVISYCGSQQTIYHIERSRLVHNTLEVHLWLSSETYRLFKHLADTLFAEDEAAKRASRELKKAWRLVFTI